MTALNPAGAGPPLIGIIGADVPRQIVLACGAVPVRLLGSWSGAVSQEASELLGAADAVALRLLDDLLSDWRDWHDGLAAIVVCNDSMANLRLFYVLRILFQRGRIRPPVHLLDAPRGGGVHRDRFVAVQYEQLAGFLAEITGHGADSASLDGAAVREAELGRMLEKVRGRRRARTLGGIDALEAYRLAGRTSPEDALDRLAPLLRASDAPPPEAVPVYVTGSSHPDATVYAVLEEAGAVVVGEDHDAGDAAWIGETVDADSLEATCRALAVRHAQRPPSAARSLSSERTWHLLAEVERTGAAGVAALVRELDDGPVWDLAEQRQALASTGTWLASAVRVPPDGAREAAADLATRFQPTERAPQ